MFITSLSKPMTRYQAGVGLVEILISMLIGLFIMAGVLQLFSSSTQNQIVSSTSSRIQENIRYAFARMSEDIGQAGNLGCTNAALLSRYDFDDSKFKNVLGVNSSPVSANSHYDFHNIVYGTSSAVDNLGGDAAADTDIFRVRYVAHSFKIPVLSVQSANQFTADDSDSDFASLKAGQIVSVSNCYRGALFVLTSDPDPADSGLITVETGTTSNIYNTDTNLELDDTNTISPNYLYGGTTGAYEYYIGTAAGASACSATDISKQGECALFRSTGKSTAAEEILQGVHDLEVLYGMTNAAGGLVYATAAAINADANDDLDWNFVDRMKVTLSFNSVVAAVKGAGNTFDEIQIKEVTRTFNFSNQL